MAMKIEVKLQKLHDDAIVPQYGTEQAAGFDFCAYTGGETITLQPAQLVTVKQGFFGFGKEQKIVPSRTLVKTGVAVELPEGFELQVRSRSGLALKQGIQVHVGTIDADYRGEIGVIMFNFGEEPFEIKQGDRIAQGVLNRVEQAGFTVVDALDKTDRGDGGFGSTGLATATIDASQISASTITEKQYLDMFTEGEGNPLTVPTLPDSEPIMNAQAPEPVEAAETVAAQPVETPETHNVGIIIEKR